MNEPVSTTTKNDGRIRLFIHALALSPVGTMGGNSKIAIEMARNLAREFEIHFIVPESRISNVPVADGVLVHPLSNYPGNEKYHPISSIRHYLPLVRDLFTKLHVGRSDVVFAMSDFHMDVVPPVLLRRQFDFVYIASAFLFVPSPWENLIQRYHFPFLKYILVAIYSRVLFRVAVSRADGFVVTNSSDFCHFPPRFRDRLLDIYGGVNLEQIEEAASISSASHHDVVFCSRLHPQKGIGQFLDVWQRVLVSLPGARLGVIGNGSPSYEASLRAKAKHLGIEHSIHWLGYVNDSRKFAIYRAARVFVHPTVYDNNGMVAAEALCSGLPVVMYDLPTLRHVYNEGCVKIPPYDHAMFAKELVRLLSNEAYRSSVAPTEQQLADISRRWNWKHRSNLFQEFVCRIVNFVKQDGHLR